MATLAPKSPKSSKRPICGVGLEYEPTLTFYISAKWDVARNVFEKGKMYCNCNVILSLIFSKEVLEGFPW